MAKYVYACDRCGVAFQADIAHVGSTEAATPDPSCPRCDSEDTTRVYQVPEPTGGCVASSGC
jgi:DNA-directed RNA polymerase subunit RPC12/RpoP